VFIVCSHRLVLVRASNTSESQNRARGSN